MKVSIIIPVYNAGDNLIRTIKCILDQRYFDYEVVLIDDGSIDQSSDICDWIVERDFRFQVVHKDNGGVSTARNIGITVTTGDFITFLDSDDIISEDYLEMLVFTQEKTCADVVCCDVVLMNEGCEQQRFTMDDAVLNKKYAIDLLLSRKNINSGPCAKLIRRSIANRVEFPLLKAYEDILYTKDVFDKSDTIAVTNKVEYQYIQNPDGAMRKFVKSPSLDIIVASRRLAEYIETKKEIDSGCLYATFSHLYQYVLLIANQKDNRSREFVKAVRSLFKDYWLSIWKCNAFPWKEKVYYTLFMLGINIK